MKIAIPTYDRCDRFSTIDFLKKNNVPDEYITIFLANEEEKTKYVSKYKDRNYNWVVGILGVLNQRNFITEYFDEGEYIVSMDDDITDLIHKDNKPFLEWIEECINYLKMENLGLLTISPCTNTFFFNSRNKTVSFKKGNYLAVGVFFIYKNHKNIKLNLGAEDYDRSMLYLKKYGLTVRYQDVLLKTIFWGKGGLSSQRTLQKYLDDMNDLQIKYPNTFKIQMKSIKKMDKNNKVPVLVIIKKNNYFEDKNI
jgi:hypothetical protein